MKIALVHPFHWDDVRRGGERYIRDLAWYLAGAGHDVTVVVGTHTRPAVSSADGATVRTVRLRVSRPLRARGSNEMDTFGVVALPTLMRHRFDVVHATVPSAALAARLAAQRTVFTVLGHPTDDQFGARPLDHALFVAAARRATVTAAFSDASATATEAVSGRRTVTLPLGIRIDDFPARETAPEGPPRLLFGGFPGEPRKGIGVALAAMPGVLDRHPDARLLLPGEPAHHAALHASLGDDRERVLAAIDHLGVLEMEQMPALLRSVTLLVLPSWNEALGITLVEALASGTPVVCSADGGMTSIVTAPEVGRTFPTRDAAALTRALTDTIALARDPATATRCHAHARAWDWSTEVGPRHESLYAEVSRS